MIIVNGGREGPSEIVKKRSHGAGNNNIKNQRLKSKIMEAFQAVFCGGQEGDGLVDCGLKERRYQ